MAPVHASFGFAHNPDDEVLPSWLERVRQRQPVDFDFLASLMETDPDYGHCTRDQTEARKDSEFEAVCAAETKARQIAEQKLASEEKARWAAEVKLVAAEKARQEVEEKLAAEEKARRSAEEQLAAKGQVSQTVEKNALPKFVVDRVQTDVALGGLTRIVPVQTDFVDLQSRHSSCEDQAGRSMSKEVWTNLVNKEQEEAAFDDAVSTVIQPTANAVLPNRMPRGDEPADRPRNQEFSESKLNKAQEDAPLDETFNSPAVQVHPVELPSRKSSHEEQASRAMSEEMRANLADEEEEAAAPDDTFSTVVQHIGNAVLPNQILGGSMLANGSIGQEISQDMLDEAQEGAALDETFKTPALQEHPAELPTPKLCYEEQTGRPNKVEMWTELVDKPQEDTAPDDSLSNVAQQISSAALPNPVSCGDELANQPMTQEISQEYAALDEAFKSPALQKHLIEPPARNSSYEEQARGQMEEDIANNVESLRIRIRLALAAFVSSGSYQSIDVPVAELDQQSVASTTHEMVSGGAGDAEAMLALVKEMLDMDIGSLINSHHEPVQTGDEWRDAISCRRGRRRLPSVAEEDEEGEEQASPCVAASADKESCSPHPVGHIPALKRVNRDMRRSKRSSAAGFVNRPMDHRGSIPRPRIGRTTISGSLSAVREAQSSLDCFLLACEFACDVRVPYIQFVFVTR